MEASFTQLGQDVARLGDGLFGFLLARAGFDDALGTVTEILVNFFLCGGHVAPFHTANLRRKILEDLLFLTAKDEGRHHLTRTRNALSGE